MAIALTPVGSGVKIQNATGAVEVTLIRAVPSGKVLVLAAYATSIVTLTGVTDDKSNSYTAQSAANSAQGNGYWVHASVATGLAAGDKIYAAFSGTASRRFVVALMVDGAAASYVDAQGSPAQTGTGAAPIVNTGPQAQAGETVLSWLFVTSPAATITEDASWSFQDEVIADNRKFHVAAKAMATTAADTYAPTLSASQSWSGNWLAIKAASASGPTLTAAAGGLALAGKAATTKATRQLPTMARSCTLARINAAVRRGCSVRADARGYPLTGHATAPRRGLRLTGASTSFALEGLAATLPRTIAGRMVGAVFANVSLTGRQAGARARRKLRTTVESYPWARLAAGLRWSRRIVAMSGAFSFAGAAIDWGWTHILKPERASVGHTGWSAKLRYSGEQGWQPIPGAPDRWAPMSSPSETWTPVGDTPEVWS